MNRLEIEKKWQNYWEENKTFKAITGDSKPHYYILVDSLKKIMFTDIYMT